MTRFTNIEAQVYYPEDDGVVQVEHFGIHARMDGTIVYGLMIESVMDRILENISLDNLGACWSTCTWTRPKSWRAC